MNVRRLMMAGAIAIALGTATTAAQTVMLEQAVIAPGGGQTSAGSMQLNATMEQAVAGTATNGTTTGSFGFWTATPTAISGVTLAGGSGAVRSIAARPNPIRTEGELTVALARRGDVRVTLHDVTGRMLATLYSNVADAGELTIPLDVTGLASGTYYVAVSMPDAMMQKPITVIR
jgi:hypothetical protein